MAAERWESCTRAWRQSVKDETRLSTENNGTEIRFKNSERQKGIKTIVAKSKRMSSIGNAPTWSSETGNSIECVIKVNRLTVSPGIK